MLYSDDLIMIVNLLQENSLLNFFRLRTTDPIQDFAPLRRNLRISYKYDCHNYVHQNKRK